MSRPLRLAFPGAIYHLTSRGNAREPIFLSDLDRQQFLSLLVTCIDRFNWVCHAYCLMDNHYHLLIETPDANLQEGMRQLNGVYTQKFIDCIPESGMYFKGDIKPFWLSVTVICLSCVVTLCLIPFEQRWCRRPGSFSGLVIKLQWGR